MSNIDKNIDNRGIPPARPLPSQIMHLLELSYLELEEAARLIHIAPATLDGWMTFRSQSPMPVGAWLLLNLATLANKGTVYPEGMREYIATAFNHAFLEVKPRRKITLPSFQPTLPTPEALKGILDLAECSTDEAAELLFESQNKIAGWLDSASGRPMPYSVFELLVLRLCSLGRYRPGQMLIDYIGEKYNGAFKQPR